MAEPQYRPVTLVILDGFALRDESKGNAVALADTPNLDRWLAEFPHSQIATSGTAVGLPEGQMGNSEVGHQNIGAGRVIYQDLTRIDQAIQNGSFANNEVISEVMRKSSQGNRTLHLMGLVSHGGVHSSQDHIYALLEMAGKMGVPRTVVHVFLDGRDTPPSSGLGFVEELTARMGELRYGRIATVSGRFYAMDRDTRWDRTKKAWDAIVHGQAEHTAPDALTAIRNAYERGETDEFVVPTVIVGDGGEPVAKVEDGDAVFHFNFRADRARQLTRALSQPDFDGFDRGHQPRLVAFSTMTQYESGNGVPAAFPPEYPHQILGEVISENGLAQFRCAETEKYAHVTYFLNGGQEKVFPGEDRVLIPSPRDVQTYDEKPEMSARPVADAVVEHIASGKYGLVVVNFANPDMVGHTGNLDAAIQAVGVVDECLGRIGQAVEPTGGSLLVTADHGNCEEMIAEDGSPHTAHTTRDVPLILVDPEHRGSKLNPGALRDIAPTILHIMGKRIPKEMTGSSLLGD